MSAIKDKPRTKSKREVYPFYNVILINDDFHTHYYVIRMMKELFGYEQEKGYEIAQKVDKEGFCIVKTCTKELAELKQEQVHSFGPDQLVAACTGAMTCNIEPV